jgi:hypothetical protein
MFVLLSACKHRNAIDIEAFMIINNSLITTNINFMKRSKGFYTEIEKQYSLNPDKYRSYYDNAKHVQKLSADLVEYLLSIKYEIIVKTDNITIEKAKQTPLSELKNKDSFKESTFYFLGNSRDGSEGKARELKNTINDYKLKLNKILGKDSTDIKITLMSNTANDKSHGDTNWEMNNFYQTLSAGSVTILNKLIVDVRNTEFIVISHLHNQMINKK